MPAEQMNSSGTIRMGILGGRFGSAFQWHEHPNCKVEAVCEMNAVRREDLKKAYRCDKSYETLKEMLEDPEIDAVSIFSGAPFHACHSMQALKAGKHVFCAVPAAMSLEECEMLRDTVEETGLTYMMAETSYYRQPMISARKFYQQGKFGNIFYAEAEYHHVGLEQYMFNDGKPTWRHGLPPMLYPTHCTSFLVGLTGERLTSVTCYGWGDGDPALEENLYGNPFWNEFALFRTDRGNAFRVSICWRGALCNTERAQWFGDKMSFFMEHPNGLGRKIVRAGVSSGSVEAGFVSSESVLEEYEQPQWWNTDLLPEPLRHGGGHDGAQPFLTHEFISALLEERRPVIDIYEAIAYTAPGIIAHQSALHDGEQMQIPNFDRP